MVPIPARISVASRVKCPDLNMSGGWSKDQGLMKTFNMQNNYNREGKRHRERVMERVRRRETERG